MNIKITIFSDVTSRSSVDRYQLIEIIFLHLQSGNSEETSIFKMEAAGPSEMLVPIYFTTQCHTPKEGNRNFRHVIAGISGGCGWRLYLLSPFEIIY
jgi:hypothetical protein